MAIDILGSKRVAKRTETIKNDGLYPNSGLETFIDGTFKHIIRAEDIKWYNTTDQEELEDVVEDFSGLGNLERLNNIRQINKFLEKANSSLQYGDYLVVCAETKNVRRTRILNKFPKFISRPYYGLDFLLNRVFPKWRLTRKLYFSITKGRNRALSFTETLGRLYSCGFKVINHVRIGYETFFIAQKIDEPAYDMQPTYGTLVGLNRVGYKGKTMKVYKVRTMHPYSEAIQDYMYETNNLQEGGKIKNDFRVTSWGKIFRKLWIDELPMIWNLLKGEMKLVGVRPLSKHYFQLYPEDMQNLRVSVKPGLVPPFYADLPDTIDEIVESERKYIESYHKSPIKTDIKYFFKAMYNIFIKRARSA